MADSKEEWVMADIPITEIKTWIRGPEAIEDHSPVFWRDGDHDIIVIKPDCSWDHTYGAVGEIDVRLYGSDVNCIDELWGRDETDCVEVVASLKDAMDFLCEEAEDQDYSLQSQARARAMEWADYLESLAGEIRDRLEKCPGCTNHLTSNL